AEAIRASTASSQSTGLLAGLSNFAQWYVPRDREPLGEGQDTSDEQAAIAATKGGTPLWMSSRQGNAEVTSADLPTDSTADYDWSIAGRGGHPVDARRRFSFENAGDNDSWRHAA
ncbi:unnamed protein product, partial [Sphacelaria rigidula]